MNREDADTTAREMGETGYEGVQVIACPVSRRASAEDTGGDFLVTGTFRGGTHGFYDRSRWTELMADDV